MEEETKKPKVPSCEGCGSPAKMRCPTCKTLNVASFFCGQECFKANWETHKSKHDPFTPVTDTYRYTGPLRPGKVTPMRSVPEHIPRPDYVATGVSRLEEQDRGAVPVWDAEGISGMRAACLLSRECLDMAHAMVRPGVTGEEIDIAVHEWAIEHNCYPSPLNYYRFPKSVCVSANEVICHGIPDDRPLVEGDIVNIDVSLYYRGYHGDLNETYFVGEVAESSKSLVRTTYESLMKSIEACKPGQMYRNIGSVISNTAEAQGFSVVRTYCGHGVGQLFHCAPTVPHYGRNKAVGKMRPGHIFTIEPMINQGTWKDQLWNDGWTSVTIDGQRSAQFEHTLLITETGVEVLTARLPTSPPLGL
jgi:methionyl aminopeptidase